MNDREKKLFLAKVSDLAERYDEMVRIMRGVVDDGSQQLSQEERDMLNVAYKNAVGARRSSWRLISSLLQRETDPNKQEALKEERQKVEKEVVSYCQEALQVLDQVIQTTQKLDFKIYFYKMKGDYNRYIGEVTADASVKEMATKSGQEAYQKALEVVENNKDQFSKVSPIVLGLSLNYSVFFFEILKNKEEAIKLAKSTFDNAIMELDTMNEDESFHDATQIMSLLKDNLNLWESEAN
eukprot:TRINITY_DN1923_c0_g2_i1.p1 TRINITY_DN1923_c0_g2~~TRINITY_DN1923_c0_g2_i1.p1  ORF type:complete len:239 (-),score=62.56 TRINITY_DN1923_c0_g2_i1:531-1247(-)